MTEFTSANFKKKKKKKKTRAPHAGANTQLQQLLENSKTIKKHNYVKKNLRITSPTGMGSPFDSKQLSEFQVNVFSNERDIRKHQFLHDADTVTNNNRAMAIPRCFLQKQLN